MKRHALSIAYAILVVFIVGSFVRVQMLADQVELESIARTTALCEASNSLRDEIQDYLSDLPPPPLPPPALAETHGDLYAYLLNEAERSIELRRQAASGEAFAEIVCPPLERRTP